MLLAPPGWTAVELTFVPVRGVLRLAELQTRGEGAKEPKPAPQLFLQPKEEALRLSEGVTELVHHLKVQGKQWEPGLVRVERTPDFVDWKLQRADGSTAWFSRLERSELDVLLITDALFDALRGTERAFHDLQGKLSLGAVGDFAFDAQHGMLKLELDSGEVEVPAQLVGQYIPELYTWVWGWSDEQTPSAAVERVRSVCAPDAQQEGMSAFWRPSYHCDEGFSWAVAGSVVVSIGARGLFRGDVEDENGPAVFFALMDLPRAGNTKPPEPLLIPGAS